MPTDQEFAALAREVLDAQNYPDMREYPGGPPERPYDAAGWTLPMPMGVRVVAATTPLADEVRANTEAARASAGSERSRCRTTPTSRSDAAPFDSVPGIGFDSNPIAAAIVPPAGRVTGSGPRSAVDPAQNNAFRAINRAWKDAGATVPARRRARRALRYIISGLSGSAQDELVQSLALVAERTSSARRQRAPCRSPRIGLFVPGARAWTRAGRAGCSSSTASRSSRSGRRLSRAACGRRSTSSS